MATDDRPPRDDVSSYPADTRQMQTYRDATEALAQLQAPVLIHADNPHERLFVASFDGTGNSKYKDPEHETNVGKISDQAEVLCGATAICGGYVEGPGTQDNFIARTWDGMRGSSYDERLEKMYLQLVQQAKVWRDADPDVQIRIADIGFSRGAEQAAGFARMVHERGIINPTDPANPIVPPGQVAQTVGLFDPVGTGMPYERDRRLPPSVISGFQITALDERRGLFKSDQIIPPGLSEDGRFLNIAVAGAHSDIGGSYHLDGLGVRNSNLMVDYLNALSDRPLLTRQVEPDVPDRNVVHRSEEGMLLYRMAPKADRAQPEGIHACAGPAQGVVLHPAGPDREGKAMSPPPVVARDGAACRAEPRDASLDDQFARRSVARAVETPQEQEIRLFSERLDRMIGAADRGDWTGFRLDQQTLANSDQGRALMERASVTVNQWKTQERYAEQQRLAEQAQVREQQRAQNQGFTR